MHNVIWIAGTGSCSHRIFSSAGLNWICVVSSCVKVSQTSFKHFFFVWGIYRTAISKSLNCTVAYTEPDIKTNSPSCWKNDVQDFSLLCPLWLKWRTFPNRVYVCVFLRDLAESLGAGRWTAWLWRERTMAWLYPSIQSSCRPSDSWAADPPSVPYWEHHQEIWHTLSAFSYTRRYLNKADCSFTFMHFGRHFYLPNTLDNPISANVNTRRSRALTSVFDICELKKEIKKQV